MTGQVTVVGLGPGAPELITPEVSAALATATDLVGYASYLARITPNPGVAVYTSDNREERTRAELALRLAAAGREVVVVSSGDPGVFAMAAVLFEAIDQNPVWQEVPVRVLPGITALLAAAARVGAPIGHDFCVLNLSDNLKPWSVIEARVEAAVATDFVIALYNPRSRARPDGFGRLLALLRRLCTPTRLLIFARAVYTPQESIRVVPLAEAEPEMADMQTLVIVGSSRTRRVGPYVYTPRHGGSE